MKLNFKYDKERDIWCILNKGKSSNNSQIPTKVYEQLTASYGKNPSKEEVSTFIDEYILENRINIKDFIVDCQNKWEQISNEYQKRAKAVFGCSPEDDITVYITINNRCPYDIENNLFFVSAPNPSLVTKTIMHELWHFYTWYGLGTDQLERLGSQKYNDLKEALTVLINLECEDLLPEGIQDDGYPQHKALRVRISELWIQKKDIHNLWETLAEED